MSLRDQLRKAASLFVEVAPDPEPVAAMADVNADAEASDNIATPPPVTKTVEDIVQQAPGPNLADITAPKPPSMPPPAGEGTIDFSSLYKSAGLPDASFTAEQMIDMLTTLPQELTLEVKRQTVKASLGSLGKSIGATPETIVTDASRKLAVLAAYTDNVEKDTKQFCAASEEEITRLQQQIADKRKAVEAAKQHYTQVSTLCHAEGERLDTVLEFFSLDVAPSKYAPPSGTAKSS